MEYRFSRTPLFILLSLALFALLNYAVPVGARYVLALPQDDYPGSRDSFFLLLRIAGLVAVSALVVALCAWAFRKLAELADTPALCRGMLVLGALLTAGHLLYGLWGSPDAGNGYALVMRVLLSAAALALCATAINATRFGLEPEFDYSEYRA